MKSYHDGILKSDVRTQYKRFSSTHPLFKEWRNNCKITEIQQHILDRLSDKKSIWVDSFGYGLKSYNPNIITIENPTFDKIIKNLSDCFIYTLLTETRTYSKLKEDFDSDALVFYKPTVLKYLTIEELASKITDLQTIYTSIIVVIDLIFLDFNKLRLTYPEVVTILNQRLPQAKITNYSKFEVIIEIS